jgi:hypothetical protein
MPTTTISGDMFSITVDGTRAEVRIWRRPDLDSEKGAQNAARIAEEALKLHAHGVRTVLLDVREAPAVAGPKSLASLSTMMAAWATARIRICILVGTDDALKMLQFTRVVTEVAPRDARVVKDEAEAQKWLASGG